MCQRLEEQVCQKLQLYIAFKLKPQDLHSENGVEVCSLKSQVTGAMAGAVGKVGDTQIHDKLGGGKGGSSSVALQPPVHTSLQLHLDGHQAQVTSASAFKDAGKPRAADPPSLQGSGCPHGQLGVPEVPWPWPEASGAPRKVASIPPPAHPWPVTGSPQRSWLDTGQPVRCPGAPCTSPAHPRPLAWLARPRP